MTARGMHHAPMCNTLTSMNACNPCDRHMYGESGTQHCCVNHCYRNSWCNKHILVVVVALTRPP